MTRFVTAPVLALALLGLWVTSPRATEQEQKPPTFRTRTDIVRIDVTVLGPDGKIYLTAGNFTGMPDDMDLEHSPKRNWAEDLLLPRNPDGGGHDPHIMAPAGWIIRFDKDGKNRDSA